MSSSIEHDRLVALAISLLDADPTASEDEVLMRLKGAFGLDWDDFELFCRRLAEMIHIGQDKDGKMFKGFAVDDILLVQVPVPPSQLKERG